MSTPALWGEIARFVRAQMRAALVTVAAARGSSPREVGARMVVRPDGGFIGSIGGGALEFMAQGHAQDLLAAEGTRGITIRQSLGPDLGQCCGGSVKLLIESFDARDLPWLDALASAEGSAPLATIAERGEDGRYLRRAAPVPAEAEAPAFEDRDGRLYEQFGEAKTPLVLFGAGHVGRALVLALAPLPFSTRWIDTRADAFPRAMPGNVTAVAAEDVTREIAAAPAGAFVLAMTHSHPQDLAIMAAALPAPYFPFVGVIGSLTKRARFRTQLLALGLSLDTIERMICPIGIAGLSGKAPAVIAASVAAQLLIARQNAPRGALVPPYAGGSSR